MGAAGTRGPELYILCIICSRSTLLIDGPTAAGAAARHALNATAARCPRRSWRRSRPRAIW